MSIIPTIPKIIFCETDKTFFYVLNWMDYINPVLWPYIIQSTEMQMELSVF